MEVAIAAVGAQGGAGRPPREQQVLLRGDLPTVVEREGSTPIGGIQVVPEGQVAPHEQPVASPCRAQVDSEERRQRPGIGAAASQRPGARSGASGDKGGGRGQAPTHGVLTTHLQTSRPGPHEDAVGVGSTQQQHQRRRERAGEQVTCCSNQVVRHRRADVGRERCDRDAGGEESDQLGPTVLGPGRHLAGETRLHGQWGETTSASSASQVMTRPDGQR